MRENTEECRLREKIRSLEIEMKELIEHHSLEFQVIKEQLKEEEQQRKSRQKKSHDQNACHVTQVPKLGFLSN